MQPMFHRFAARCCRWLPGLVVVAAASGCANGYLHSDTRQKQGEAASKAWSDIDNAAPISTQRENLKKLLQAEQDTQRRVAEARRESLATAIVAPPLGQADRAAQSVAVRLVAAAQREFEALVGPIAEYDQRTAAARATEPSSDAIDRLSQRLRARGSPVAGCSALKAGALPQPVTDDWLKSLTVQRRESASVDLESLVSSCAQIQLLGSGGAAPPAGPVLLAAIADRRKDLEELQRQQSVFAAAKARYARALEDYQAAEADAAQTPADAKLDARLAAAAQTLKTQINTLRGLNNALAQEFIADETLDSIDSALAAIAGGDAGDDTRKGVILAVQAPALVQRYRDAIAASKKPLALPLLIRRNAEQLQRDAAATDVRLLEAKLALDDRIIEAVHIQARTLRRALRELDRARVLDSQDSAGKPKPNLIERQLSWTEALEATDGPARQLLLSGAALYLDAMSRLEGERFRLSYARIALDHERGLAYAETSVAQWANLIGAGVGQLDAFGQGGINGAVFSDLAKVLGLFWIGHGVNP